MQGPARRGRKGRQPGDPLTVRSEPVRLTLRPGEYDDLVAIADGWGVPIGTAGWAIVADYLAKLRGVRADLADVGIAIAAAQAIGTRVDPGNLAGAADSSSGVAEPGASSDLATGSSSGVADAR